jgi:hypothetical protein
MQNLTLVALQIQHCHTADSTVSGGQHVNTYGLLVDNFLKLAALAAVSVHTARKIVLKWKGYQPKSWRSHSQKPQINTLRGTIQSHVLIASKIPQMEWQSQASKPPKLRICPLGSLFQVPDRVFDRL